MSDVVDPVGAAPETRSVKFLTLLLAACAAPVFWLGQLMLGYGVTAYVCYPGDHPQGLAATGPLFAALLAFDAVALIACAAGGAVSYAAGRRGAGGGRDRFLALWGIMSSLWFFAAILFNTIASVTVPPCLS
jgi:hypothetical protein